MRASDPSVGSPSFEDEARHDVLSRLEADGLLERRNGAHRTTRRWQAAMARAALRVLRAQGDGDDLRVPIIEALVELYGPDVSDEGLTTFVEAMLPIELRELHPQAQLKCT
jgi:hypothetical protein